MQAMRKGIRQRFIKLEAARLNRSWRSGRSGVRIRIEYAQKADKTKNFADDDFDIVQQCERYIFFPFWV